MPITVDEILERMGGAETAARQLGVGTEALRKWRQARAIAARGLVVKQDITESSNWRAAQPLDVCLRGQGIAGLAGVDTRALTVRIRDGGAPTGVLTYPRDGRFDLAALQAQAQAWPGLEG